VNSWAWAFSNGTSCVVAENAIPSPSMVQLTVFVKDIKNEPSHVFDVQFIYFKFFKTIM
jgi:hypothetical protein